MTDRTYHVPLPSDGKFHLVTVRRTRKGRVKAYVDEQRVDLAPEPSVGTIEFTVKRAAPMPPYQTVRDLIARVEALRVVVPTVEGGSVSQYEHARAWNSAIDRVLEILVGPR